MYRDIDRYRSDLVDLNEENEMFKEYGYKDDMIDPIEELRLRGNKLSNVTFYHLAHSPSFQNLKVLDLRENNISSVSSLNVNRLHIQLPALKEFYLDITPKIENREENIE